VTCAQTRCSRCDRERGEREGDQQFEFTRTTIRFETEDDLDPLRPYDRGGERHYRQCE
jgi:hypothetical protein